MKVTFAEVPDGRLQFDYFWNILIEHIKVHKSQLVVFNEFCFIPWFTQRDVSLHLWSQAVRASEEWEKRLHELGAPVVIGSRPVYDGDNRYNEGFVWTKEGGLKGVHKKNYLPEEEDFWEMSWYSRGDGSFTPATVPNVAGRDLTLGFQMCSELWFPEHGREYGKQGVTLIVSPRATGAQSLEKWLVGAKALAVISGAFVVSSNRVGGMFGGQGWLVDPDGSLIAKTDAANPIVTSEINLDLAVAAKSTYPRYIVPLTS